MWSFIILFIQLVCRSMDGMNVFIQAKQMWNPQKNICYIRLTISIILRTNKLACGLDYTILEKLTLGFFQKKKWFRVKKSTIFHTDIQETEWYNGNVVLHCSLTFIGVRRSVRAFTRNQYSTLQINNKKNKKWQILQNLYPWKINKSMINKNLYLLFIWMS